MIEIFLDKFLAPCLLALVTALSSYMVYVLKENRKASDANSKGIMLLLRRQIISDHKRFCDLGETMTHFDYEDIVEVHDTYKALGGNGLTDKMYEELQQIDIGGTK